MSPIGLLTPNHLTTQVAISLVQEVAVGSASGGAASVSNASNVTAGNSLVLIVQLFYPGTDTSLATVTDTKTGTWTNVFVYQDPTTFDQFEVWICNNPQAGVMHEVVVTPT